MFSMNWRTAGVQAIFQNPFETFNPLRQVEQSFFDAVMNLMTFGNKIRTGAYIV